MIAQNVLYMQQRIHMFAIEVEEMKAFIGIVAQRQASDCNPVKLSIFHVATSHFYHDRYWT